MARLRNTVSTVIDDADLERLDAAAAAKGQRRSTVIREALVASLAPSPTSAIASPDTPRRRR